jgi:ParB family transcriptional regulator, chromosome partitioning protein
MGSVEAPGLSDDDQPSPAPGRTEFQLIPLELIDPRPDQPRRAIRAERLQELADSIRECGVLQPIRVRAVGDRFEIIAGERRWIAAGRAGLEAVPAVVVHVDDGRVLVEALIENVQREDLNAVDRAVALQRLRSTLGLRSWAEVGRRIGISRVHVHRLLNVTRLPEPMQSGIRAGSLTEKHGRALLRLKGHPRLQRQLWQQIQSQRLSGDATMAVCRQLLPRPRHRAERPAGTETTRRRAELRALVDRLLSAVLVASPQDVEKARVELNDLRCWLNEVLEARFGRWPTMRASARTGRN